MFRGISLNSCAKIVKLCFDGFIATPLAFLVENKDTVNLSFLPTEYSCGMALNLLKGLSALAER